MNPTTWEAVWAQVVLYAPRVLGGVAVLAAFWLGGRGLQSLIVRLAQVRRVDPSLVLFFGRTARFALVAFGVITAAGTLGIDVSALVAGLGLTGFAVGFALKDIISNALSGMLIIIYRPFRENDRLTMTTFEGTVRDVNLRYTVLDMGEKRVFIPNSLLFTNAIVVQPQSAGAAEGPGTAGSNGPGGGSEPGSSAGGSESPRPA